MMQMLLLNNQISKKASFIFKQLIDAGLRDSATYFGEAMAQALSNEKETAILYFDTAARRGWADLNTWQMIISVKKLSDNPIIIKATELVRQNSNSKARSNNENSEVHSLFQQDQNDRAELMSFSDLSHLPPEFIMKLAHNDSLRRDQVYHLLKDKKIKKAIDFHEAAFILQHGNDSNDFNTAHKLALFSVQLGDSTAKYIVAATLDRYLVYKGIKQKYGTQSYRDKASGKLLLYPVDPSISDEERAKWDVPPIKDALKSANSVYGE